MKITVVGAGNAGCATALYYSYYTAVDKVPNVEIELVYDDQIPAEKVGQGTFPDMPELLWYALGCDWYNNPIQCTIKKGFLYENWGKKNHKFFHAFPFGKSGIHHDTSLFQKSILESGLFKVRNERVTNLDDIDADFIFDCRGKPAELNEEYEELVNPLNCCLLGTSHERQPNENWTRAVATPDGWCFVIPNTIETTSFGYLFNEEYTTREEAASNLLDLFGIESNEFLTFNKYVAKEPIQGRVILNGNKLFFLEPLEGTALSIYLGMAARTYKWLILKESHPKQISQDTLKLIHECEKFILWHYTGGSKYESKFWSYATKLAKTLPCKRFDEVLDITLNNNELDIRSLVGCQIQYGSWCRDSIKNWWDNAIVFPDDLLHSYKDND